MEVYSASGIWGRMVLGIAISELQGAQCNANATLRLVEDAEASLGVNPLRLATALALVIPIEVGAVMPLSTAALLAYVGMSKRMAMASVSRVSVVLA